MPSTRALPLNPRLGRVLPGGPTQAQVLAPAPAPAPASAAARMLAPPTRTVPVLPPAGAALPEDDDEREEKARAGGFHESSYELKQGLDVTESEWPPDITTPGALGPR